MKVFISWSGDLSKSIAEVFKQWIPAVIQAAKPYYSPDDITKGTRWSTEISKELDESKLGIICLTKDNLHSPWIMFEAGSLSKNIDQSKVCPILFDIEPSDVEGPLVQFQAAKFSQEEIKRVVKMINSELGDLALSNDVLDNVFNMWWADLNSKITEVLTSSKKSKKEIRSERDLLEEVLKLAREISLNKNNSYSSKIPFMLLEEIFESISRVMHNASNGNTSSQFITDELLKVCRLLEEFIYGLDLPAPLKSDFLMQLRFINDHHRDFKEKNIPSIIRKKKIFPDF
jgi:TIR domain